MFAEMSSHRPDVPSRWPAVLRQAQHEMARCLSQAGFGRQARLDWLAGESGVCRLCATAMDAVAGWHYSQPDMHATAQDWAAELRELARLAAADARALGGITSAPLPLQEEWRVFLEGASGSQRVGEALGAIALHARLFPGESDAALGELVDWLLPRGASHYLMHRRQGEPLDVHRRRDALLELYSDTALAAGARRASAWSHDALAQAYTASARHDPLPVQHQPTGEIDEPRP